MEEISSSQEIPIFKAPQKDERKTIAIKAEQKFLRPNLIPDSILQDTFLASLIGNSLPKNYNFEVYKTIWKIKQVEARLVLLQFPEGLIRFGPVIVDILKSYFSKDDVLSSTEFVIMGDLTYGACCIDDILASSMNCDLIIHYAHSCLVPINQLTDQVKYLYIFLDIKFSLDHLVTCVEHNFTAKQHRIAMASTIQFVSSTHEVAKRLRESGYQITLPQSRPLTSGEVLGCTAPKLSDDVNVIIFICDGRFHLEALMIANPKVSAYRYDPYSRKLTREAYAFDQMYEQRMNSIERAVEVMSNKGRFGFILGTLGRQGSEMVYDKLINQFQDSSNCLLFKMLMPEVDQNILKHISQVDIWVQVACPRLSIDWGTFFPKPLLNPYELAKSVKLLKNRDQQVEITEKVYPMDYYAKNSCGYHTPNHVCQNNMNCNCR